MTPPRDRIVRWPWALAGFAALVLAGACHDPDAPPAASPPPQVSDFVIEHMGRGGALRRVIYEPPPDLARIDPGEIELPFPGPGVDDEETPDPTPEDDDDPGDDTEPDSDVAPGGA